MRLADWRKRLNAEVDASRVRPMAYGSHDCLQFSARCVEAVTGSNYVANFPPYSSEAQAFRILAEHGGVTGLITSVLGEPIAPNLAHVGDIVVADYEGRETAGVCMGINCAFVNEAGGLVFWSRERIVRGWKV